MNKEESKIAFGRKLKEIRVSRGMSQEELAKALGYTNRSSINKIEIGRSSIPIEKIVKMAEILGVSPLDLFQEEPADMQVEEDGTRFVIEFQNLTKSNQALVLAYMKALNDSQEKEDGHAKME